MPWSLNDFKEVKDNVVAPLYTLLTLSNNDATNIY